MFPYDGNELITYASRSGNYRDENLSKKKNDAWDKVAKEVSLERYCGRQMKKIFNLLVFPKNVKKTVAYDSATKYFCLLSTQCLYSHFYF